MATKNNRGRGMLFMCFKPPSSDTTAVVDGPVELLRSSSSDDQSGRRRNKSGRRCFTGVFRDVFPLKSTMKNFGSKNSRTNSFRSNGVLSSECEKGVDSTKKDESFKDEEILRTNSNSSSIFSPSSSSIMASNSSSSSSSISCNSRSASQQKCLSSLDLKQSNTINKKSKKMDFDNSSWNNGPTIGICTILCCLVALILWGKVVAILICTTTWLFFVPCHIRAVDLPPVNNIESEGYKKRVIMEGFLERSNRPSVVLS